MATLTYNGVSLTSVRITRFATVNEFENNNRNRTAKAYVMEGVGIFKNDNPPGFATNIASIRNTMTVPGKLLSITWDVGSASPTTIQLADGYNGTAAIADVQNGPLPEITVNEIHGGNSGCFIVGFSFRWHNCNASPIQRAEVVTTHSIDEDGTLTITRSGFLSVSASNTGNATTTVYPINDNGQPQITQGATYYGGAALTAAQSPANPDMYRQLVAGKPPSMASSGFGYTWRRVRQDYYVQPDQRTLVFTVVDKSVAATLPAPAVSGDASFEYERGLDETRMFGRKTFRCELNAPVTQGGITSAKQDLFAQCMEVALTRIRFQPYGSTPPDTILSFKIEEGSLFQRCSVRLEIVATGVAISPRFEPNGLTDAWLYVYLFTNPNPVHLGSTPEAYTSGPSGWIKTPKFVFDPCTLSNTWQEITGATSGQTVSPPPVADADTDAFPLDEDSFASPQDGERVDPLLEEDAAKALVGYSATQSVSIDSKLATMETMGGDHQFTFQMSLPRVYITQSVNMTTKVRGMNVPWPVIDDPYTVVEQNIDMNDGPPDAAGNRIIVMRATRTLQVTVSSSANLRRYTGSDPREVSGPSRAVWMPSSMPLPRNALTGSVEVSLKENRNGQAVQQDYVDPRSLGA